MRFGLVGTGFWARQAHAPALIATPNVSLDGVWGRDPAATRELAREFGSTAYDSFDEMLDAVDAVGFAVPPDVQAAMATRAASRGKHLLLDKPVATSLELSNELAEAAAAAKVATSVFFTARFQPEIAGWLEGATQQEWTSVEASWICSAFEPGSPFVDSQWRREKGALWDVGPHALSVVLPLLGPVSEVTARRGRGDLVHLLAEHEAGATSTINLTLDAPQAALDVRLTAWGASGRETMPTSTTSATDALQAAIEDLVQRAVSGETAHLCDVAFGRYVVSILETAQQSLRRS